MEHRQGSTSYILLMTCAALVIGFAAGWWVNQTDNGSAAGIIPWAEFLGKVWLTLLIVLAIPLVGSYLFSLVFSMSGGRIAGRIGLHALAFHLIIMVVGIGFTLSIGFAVTTWIIGDFTLTPDQLVIPYGEGTPGLLLIHWINRAQNFFAKLILPALFLVATLALFVARFSSGRGNSWLFVMNRVSNQTTRLMNMLLVLMPLAALCLSFTLTAEYGSTLVGIMGQYVLALIGMLIVFTAVLYGIAAICGGVSIGRFTKALFPAQVVAASTRSSLATMPSLLQSAEGGAGIPAPVARLVIPLSVSVFRLNRAITSIFSYVFLTALYNITTDVGSILLFAGTIIVLSFGSPGLPSGGKLVTMPIFLAMGVPLEMIVLTKAIDVVPDVFKTVLNVTEAMTLASLVTKSTNQKPALSSKPISA